MKESEYFDTIEKLGKLVREATELVLRKGVTVHTEAGSGFSKRIAETAAEADMIAECAVRSLSSDFITPINRGDISTVVLSLRPTVSTACLVQADSLKSNVELKESCLSLAVIIEKYSTLLRGIKKKKPLPSAAAYFGAARIIKKAPPGFSAVRGEQNINTAAFRLYNGLCSCCEALITATLSNI